LTVPLEREDPCSAENESTNSKYVKLDRAKPAISLEESMRFSRGFADDSLTAWNEERNPALVIE